VRVILAGATGVRKDHLINKILGEVLKQKNLPLDPDNVNSRKYIRYFNLEKELEQKYKAPLWSFLTNLNEREQHDRWSGTFESIMTEIDRENPRHVLLSMHMTFFQSSRFFTLIDQTKLKLFRPDLFVTLVDDTYAVWQRIVSKSESQEDPGQNYLRLRDIMSWRTVEILVADLVATQLSNKNFILAVKHPVKTLFDLIFNPQKTLVYASFPISVTREDPIVQKEINSFRQHLHENYIALDPLTIDEKIIQFILREANKKGGADPSLYYLRKESRWAFPKGHSLVDDEDLPFPVKLKKDEIEEVDRDIEDNVRSRDIRLVSDVDALVGYRPYFGKHVHEGIKTEIDFATLISKPRFLYFPEDDVEEDPSAFKAKGVEYRKLDDLYSALAKFRPKEIRSWGGV
jgi:adenylate kinase